MDKPFSDLSIQCSRYRCDTYRMKIDDARINVIEDAGKIVLKSVIVGVAGLVAYCGASNGDLYSQMSGIPYLSQIIGVVTGAGMGYATSEGLKVKDSIKHMVDSYRDFRINLRSYEFAQHKLEESEGRHR